MDNKINTQAKAELVRVLGQRHRESSKMAKTQILDEFISVSGYHLVRIAPIASGRIRWKVG